MFLKLLEHAMRIKTRITIVEPGDKTQRDEIVFGAVNPSAPIFVEGQRVAHGVDDLARRDAPGGQLPQLLHSDPVGLWIAFFIELEAAYELLGQRAARAFRHARYTRLSPRAGRGGGRGG